MGTKFTKWPFSICKTKSCLYFVLSKYESRIVCAPLEPINPDIVLEIHKLQQTTTLKEIFVCEILGNNV